MRQKSATPSPDVDLAALAARQHGVVSLNQLHALGLRDGAIARRVRAGRLHRLHRGVYAVGHTAVRSDGRWLAAVMSSGDGAVLSHRSAAALWALRPTSSARIDVSVAGTSGRAGRPGIVLHRSRRPIESTVVGGIPVTTPARTLVDLADVVPARALERAAEHAQALRLLDMAAVDALVAAHPGRSGPRRVQRLLLALAHDLDTTTRSVLEDAFLELCDRHAIPRPAVNARIDRFDVDFCWRAQRLIVETDGHRHHGTRTAFEADRARDGALTALGWRVVRFTHRHIRRDPAATATLLRRLLTISVA